MATAERDRVIGRIAELRSMLRLAETDDVRETIRLALADCERRLAELDEAALPGQVAEGRA